MKIAQDPTKSMKTGVWAESGSWNCQESCEIRPGLESYERTSKHLLTEAMKTRRQERYRKVRSFPQEVYAHALL